MDEHHYTVKVVQKEGGKGGAEGRVAFLSEPTNPHFVTITVQSPVEFKGPAGPDQKSLYWSPEDLFVSSVAVCFFTTFVSIAENSNLKYKSLSITAIGKLEKLLDHSSLMSEIQEHVELSLETLNDQEKAKKIIEKTEKNCLIANSMKSKIILNFNIT
jgi:organic hydroperoxide reductase OsmC/OhrA